MTNILTLIFPQLLDGQSWLFYLITCLWRQHIQKHTTCEMSTGSKWRTCCQSYNHCRSLHYYCQLSSHHCHWPAHKETKDCWADWNHQPHWQSRPWKNDLQKTPAGHFQLCNQATLNHLFIVTFMLDPTRNNLEMFNTQTEMAYKHVDNLLMSASTAICSSEIKTRGTITQLHWPSWEPLQSHLCQIHHILTSICQFQLLETLMHLHGGLKSALPFPAVASVAAWYLAISTSSHMTAQQVSTAGRPVTKLHNCLYPNHADTTLSLYKNKNSVKLVLTLHLAV